MRVGVGALGQFGRRCRARGRPAPGSSRACRPSRPARCSAWRPTSSMARKTNPISLSMVDGIGGWGIDRLSSTGATSRVLGRSVSGSCCVAVMAASRVVRSRRPCRDVTVHRIRYPTWFGGAYARPMLIGRESERRLIDTADGGRPGRRERGAGAHRRGGHRQDRAARLGRSRSPGHAGAARDGHRGRAGGAVRWAAAVAAARCSTCWTPCRARRRPRWRRRWRCAPARAADRFAVGAGTLGLICRAAERRPLALIIDDAHLLDRPSAEALAFAARRLLADAVLLLAGVRAGEPCALTEVGLPEVADRCPRPTPRRPLLIAGRDAIRPAGGSGRSAVPGDRRQSTCLAGALDRHLTGCCRLPPDAPVPVPRPSPGRWRGKPPAGSGSAHGAGGRRGVRRGALPGAACDGDARRRLVGAGAAERADLLSVHGRRVGFRHPLVRSSVYGAADPDDRRAVHRHAVRRAAGSGPGTPGVASGRGGRPGRTTRRPLCSSGRRRGRRPQRGCRCRDRVRARGPAGAPTAGRRRPSGVRGESAWLAGQSRRARALLAEALAVRHRSCAAHAGPGGPRGHRRPQRVADRCPGRCCRRPRQKPRSSIRSWPSRCWRMLSTPASTSATPPGWPRRSTG